MEPIQIKVRAKYRNVSTKNQSGGSNAAPKKGRKKTGVVNHKPRVMHMDGHGHKVMKDK